MSVSVSSVVKKLVEEAVNKLKNTFTNVENWINNPSNVGKSNPFIVSSRPITLSDGFTECLSWTAESGLEGTPDCKLDCVRALCVAVNILYMCGSKLPTSDSSAVKHIVFAFLCKNKEENKPVDTEKLFERLQKVMIQNLRKKGKQI